MASDFNDEISRAQRFEFGKNWKSFLETVGDAHILQAKESLKGMLGVESLAGLSFLDAGCGSGLFSLAALQLGADKVHSFDFDPSSVACARELKQLYAPEAHQWVIEVGNMLDSEYLVGLGKFNIIYSWGVLHHTGNMRQSLENITLPLEKRGSLFIAIYNDQGIVSSIWIAIKKTFNILPNWLRFFVVIPTLVLLWAPRTIYDILRGKPFYTWRHYSKKRGMSAWHDLIDWVGGYPFEVAKPEEIFDFYYLRNFELKRLKTCGGKLGCNEFVFHKK